MRANKRKTLIAFSFFLGFSFYSPFIGLYMENFFNSSSQEILFAFSVFSFSTFIFEIPTGIISDRFGERFSLISGSIFQTAATILMILGGYSLFIVGEIVFALAQSLFSGSFESLVYKFCEEPMVNQDYDEVLGRTTSMAWLSVSLAALLSYIFARRDLRLVFYATIAANITCIVLSLRLPRVSRKESKRRNSILGQTIHHLKENALFAVWMVRSTVYMAVVTTGYLMIQTYLNEQGISGPSNGLLYFSITIFAFVSSALFPKIRKLTHTHKSERLLTILIILVSGTFLALSIADSFFLVLLFVCLFRLSWGFSGPFFTSILNRSISNDSIRNSSLSIKSLATNLLNTLLVLFLSFFNARNGYLMLAAILVLLVASIALEKNQQD